MRLVSANISSELSTFDLGQRIIHTFKVEYTRMKRLGVYKMAKTARQIIKIDEELCNGCGLCVPSCAEGALQIIDGKARMVAEKYCDGLGACLGECPQGAISFETREAEDFDEAAAMEHVKKIRHPAPEKAHNHHSHGGFVCPSSRTIDRTHENCGCSSTPVENIAEAKSELKQWPVKLYLVNPQAPYFQDADLLVAADCVPFAYSNLHPDFLKGKALVTGCPKFDDTEVYLQKLTDIVCFNNLRSITVLKMEVPCCSGMQRIAEMAVASSGKNIAIESVTISLEGAIKN